MGKLALEKLSVVDYMDLFFKRKKLLITPVIIFFFLSLLVCSLAQPQYKASTLVMVENMKVKEVVGTRAQREAVLYRELTKFGTLFLSKPFLALLARELDMGFGRDASMVSEKTLLDLKKSLSIEPQIREGMLQIVAYDEDAVFCAKLANTATQLFIKYYLEKEYEQMASAIDFLREQQQLYKKRLEKAETRLRKFKERNQLLFSEPDTVDLDDELKPVAGGGQNNLSQYNKHRNEIFNLKGRLEEAIRRKDELELQFADGSENIPAETIDDPVVQEMQKQLTDKFIELSRLKAVKTEAHPALNRLRREIEQLEDAVKERLRALSAGEKMDFNPIYRSLKIELAVTEDKIDSLRARIRLSEKLAKELGAAIKTIPQREQALANLRRDRNIAAKMYTKVTTKLETASIDQRLEQKEKGVSLTVIEPAVVPFRPHKPNKQFIIMFGLLFGAMVGIGMASFAEAADTSFNTPQQLEEVTKMPVLGTIDLMYSVEEAEQVKARYNLVIFSIIILALSAFAGLGLRFFLSL